jgi:hypothetical protein
MAHCIVGDEWNPVTFLLYIENHYMLANSLAVLTMSTDPLAQDQ